MEFTSQYNSAYSVTSRELTPEDLKPNSVHKKYRDKGCNNFRHITIKTKNSSSVLFIEKDNFTKKIETIISTMEQKEEYEVCSVLNKLKNNVK